MTRDRPKVNGYSDEVRFVDHRAVGASFCIALSILGSSRAGIDSSGVKLPPVEARFNDFTQLQTRLFQEHLPHQRTADIISKAYAVQFRTFQSPANIPRLAELDVQLLFRAADATLFYTDDRAFLRDMILDTSELEKRKADCQVQYADLFNAFVATRMFGAARAVATKHPSIVMARLPKFRDVSSGGRAGPTAMDLSSDERQLWRRDFRLSMPAQVVIVASPVCHFCEAAVIDIERDPHMRAVLQQHAIWLAPPDSSIPFDAVADWNRSYPAAPMKLAYSFREWPVLDRWDTPTFYFLERGRVVSEFSGWSSQKSKGQLRAALRHIGFL